MGPVIGEGSFKSTKLSKKYVPSYSPGHGEFKSLFFFRFSSPDG